MTWSRIIDTPLGRAARARYARETYRTYHPFAHVERLYHHVEHTLHLPYDPDLDEAILVHDVIYDRYGLNELRSVQWHQMMIRPADHHPAIVGQVDLFHPVAQHVMRTVDHIPNSTDNRIILADLLDFADIELTRRNSYLLKQEGMLMHGCSAEEWAQSTVTYLTGLLARIRDNLGQVCDPTERELFEQITLGIQSAIENVSFMIASKASTFRKLTREEIIQGWVYADALRFAQKQPPGEYLHLGGDRYAYRGPRAAQLA